jgi:hypothetical protein
MYFLCTMKEQRITCERALCLVCCVYARQAGVEAMKGITYPHISHDILVFKMSTPFHPKRPQMLTPSVSNPSTMKLPHAILCHLDTPRAP